MRRSVWLGVFGALIAAFAVRGAVAATCPGDCGNTQSVMINDLIICVSIDLGTQQVSACPACDVNMDGNVTVNEVIDAVNSALYGCPGAPTPTAGAVTPTPSMPICGNGVVEGDEDCDPPNLDADKECAANCTFATRRTANLDPAASVSPIQFPGTVFATLQVSGTQVLTTGRARDNAVFGPGGKQLFAPGEAPIAVKAADVHFDPINVNGLACACIRAVAEPSFSAGLSTQGISGIGVAGCGPQGLPDVNFLLEQDHDTNPASPGDGGTGGGAGLPDDPECTMTSTADVSGSLHDAATRISSTACQEGVGIMCSGILGTEWQYAKHYAIPSCVGGSTPGATCSKASDCPGKTCAGGPNDSMACSGDPDCAPGTCQAAVCKTGNTLRPAACNSPRTYTFSGSGPTGSVLLINKTSQTLLPNVATNACVGAGSPGNCQTAAFGPDCQPCTDDDVLQVPAMVVPTTSGTATIKVYDANDTKGATFGEGVACGAKPCLGHVTGIGADCERLKNDPNAPLTGALVTVAPSIDSQLGDAIVLTTLQAQTPAP